MRQENGILGNRWVLVGAVLAGMAALMLLPLNAWLLALIEWIRGAGLVGASLYVGLAWRPWRCWPPPPY